MWRYWRTFVDAFREARLNVRRRRLERSTPWRPDEHKDRLERLLPKKLDRSLDSKNGASE